MSSHAQSMDNFAGEQSCFLLLGPKMDQLYKASFKATSLQDKQQDRHKKVVLY